MVLSMNFFFFTKTVFVPNLGYIALFVHMAVITCFWSLFIGNHWILSVLTALWYYLGLYWILVPQQNEAFVQFRYQYEDFYRCVLGGISPTRVMKSEKSGSAKTISLIDRGILCLLLHQEKVYVDILGIKKKKEQILFCRFKKFNTLEYHFAQPLRFELL